MTRIKAALTHLLISASLSSIVICLLLFYWYPLPFFWALGGLMLLALIVGIDVVLGPIMTLILFNPEKSRRALTLDMSLIAIVQIAALSYGLYSGYVSRMVYGVFDGQRFQLVQASDIVPDFLRKTRLPAYRELPVFVPKFVALSIPDDPAARSDMVFYGAFGVGPQFMPQYYVPLEQAGIAPNQAALSRSQLQSRNPALAAEIDQLLQKNHLSWQETVLLPFEVKTATYTAVVRHQPMAVIKILPFSL